MFLAAFMLMGLEGYLCYQAVLRVLKNDADIRRSLYIAAYSVPVAIIGLTWTASIVNSQVAFGGLAL